MGLSMLFGVILFAFGGALYAYSEENHCVEKEYVCGNNESTTVTLSVTDGFGSGPAMIYMGLSGFYSSYMSLKSSFSSTQLQATPRNKLYMPFSDCDPIQKLSDVPSQVTDRYIPIDAFASNPNWRNNFNLTEVASLTLRPCGSLFYWILTDRWGMEDASGSAVTVSTSDLSWDDLDIPSEPAGQTFPYVDAVTNEFVWADPSTQWFRAWMRSNTDSTFAIKAGQVNGGLPAGDYTFRISQCRDLDCGKSIRICTTRWMGVNQTFLAAIFFAIGAIVIIAMLAFLLAKPSRVVTN